MSKRLAEFDEWWDNRSSQETHIPPKAVAKNAWNAALEEAAKMVGDKANVAHTIGEAELMREAATAIRAMKEN